MFHIEKRNTYTHQNDIIILNLFGTSIYKLKNTVGNTDKIKISNHMWEILTYFLSKTNGTDKIHNKHVDDFNSTIKLDLINMGTVSPNNCKSIYSFQVTWDSTPSGHMLEFKANQNKCQETVVSTVLFDGYEIKVEINSK